MVSSTVFVVFAVALLNNFAAGQLTTGHICLPQPLFGGGFATPLVCEGDAGGSQFTTIGSSTIVFEVLAGERKPILGFPSLRVPERLVLKIIRSPKGAIRKGDSYIDYDGARFKYSTHPPHFRAMFNALQVLVRQFETGNCPIDSNGQSFPELASVRGSLLALAPIFKVKDCSDGNTM